MAGSPIAVLQTMLYSCPLPAMAHTNLLHGLPWSSPEHVHLRKDTLW